MNSSLRTAVPVVIRNRMVLAVGVLAVPSSCMSAIIRVPPPSGQTEGTAEILPMVVLLADAMEVVVVEAVVEVIMAKVKVIPIHETNERGLGRRFFDRFIS